MLELEITDILPQAPGTSPFHARGVFYDQVLKHAAATPGGVKGMLAHIPDDRVRDFMQQRFRWGDWYDALPMVPVQAALCRLQGGDFETLVRKRARAAAEALVPRIFRVILGLGSPKAAAEHLPRLLSYYYDFSDILIVVEGNRGNGRAVGIPRLVAIGYVNTLIGLIEGSLRLMGAQAVRGDYSDVKLGQPRHGFETIDCTAHFEWVK